MKWLLRIVGAGGFCGTVSIVFDIGSAYRAAEPSNNLQSMMLDLALIPHYVALVGCALAFLISAVGLEVLSRLELMERKGQRGSMAAKVAIEPRIIPREE